MNLTLLVLAAGIGSRYGGLKQLTPMGPSGEVIIDYSVYDAIDAGFNKIVFVIREEFEDLFKEKISNKYPDTIQIEFVHQEMHDLPIDINYTKERTKPWGTGHAIWITKNVINEVFAVINADDFYGKESFQILADHLKKLNPTDTTNHCVVGYSLQNTLSDNGSVSRGVCSIDENNNLTSIVERKQISKKNGIIYYTENEQEFPLKKDEIVSMNMMGFTPVVFEQFEENFISFLQENSQTLKTEFLLPTVANNLIQEKKAAMTALPTSSQWFGVTYKEDKAIVEEKINELIKNGEYPSQLWK